MERVTPDEISQVGFGDMFVFGSNESGIHGAGAAKFALDHCGAISGIGFGPQGRSFGIPTKNWNLKVLSLFEISFYTNRFIDWINYRVPKDSKAKIYVTRIGCGLAGFEAEDIAPIFAPLRNHKNVWLPQD